VAYAHTSGKKRQGASVRDRSLMLLVPLAAVALALPGGKEKVMSSNRIGLWTKYSQ
jgi:hypothetical protein